MRTKIALESRVRVKNWKCPGDGVPDVNGREATVRDIRGKEIGCVVDGYKGAWWFNRDELEVM